MNVQLKEYLRQVSPSIDPTGWAPTCPVCLVGGINIDVNSYFTFVHRHWCYGTCLACNKRLLLDIPTLLYNFWYPQMMDLETGVVYGKDSWWKGDMYDMYFGFFAQKPEQQKQREEQKSQLAIYVDKLTEAILQKDSRRLLNAIEKHIGTQPKSNIDSTQIKPSLRVTRKNNSASNAILLFNCLDEYYGHSTRFIQFVYNTYDEIGELLKSEGISLVLLIPEALECYTPDFVDEIWVATHLPKPFGRKTFRTVEFNRQLKEEIQKRTVYLLKKQPNIGAGVNARTYFHMENVEKKATIKLEDCSPKVVFYHREDYRCWGGHPKQELKNYSELAALIKKEYPFAGIYLVGLKQTHPVGNPHIIDLRGENLSADYHEARINYLYLLSHADCAIGIHGSHITEMSALSKTVVTLQPKFKYPNYSDDLFLIKSSNFVAEYQRYYSIFGNDYLSDVSPERVFDLFHTALFMMREKYQYYITE